MARTISKSVPVNDQEMYRQCLVVRTISSGTESRHCWLPIRYAVVGKVLWLKDDDGKWVPGWKVITAGSTLLPEDKLDQNRRYYPK